MVIAKNCQADYATTQFNRYGEYIMSSPKAPYYYKKGTDTYHWETKCSKNHYPDADWVKTDEKPASKEQCNECKGK